MRYQNFDEAFNDIYPRVVRTLMVASGDKDIATNIAQESLAYAYAHWKKCQKQEDPIAWVREIAIKKLKSKIYKETEINLVDEHIDMDLNTFEILEKVIRTPYAIDFVKAVGNLAFEERIVATLTFIDDCTPHQIAKILGLAEENIRTDIYNARVSIRHSMSSAI